MWREEGPVSEQSRTVILNEERQTDQQGCSQFRLLRGVHIRLKYSLDIMIVRNGELEQDSMTHIVHTSNFNQALMAGWRPQVLKCHFRRISL